MAKKDASFDVVSEVDIQEVDNAYQQAVKAVGQRYDLKDTNSTISFSKADKRIVIEAPSDFVIGQIKDILNSKLTKRGIELNFIQWDQPKPSSGAMMKSEGTIVEGIDKELAKKISKDIRDLKLKVKPTVEGDKLRVTSPSRDALQEVIAFLRQQDYGQPLQFNNYR